jgi:CRP-like cAMP-binding protein
MKILNGESLLAEWGLDRFKAGSTFGALSDEAIRFLLSRGRVVSLADGEELFHTGDASDCFFVVLEGQLDCFREDDDVDVSILVVAFGEQIGYASMIGLSKRLGSGRGHGPTVMLQISSDLFYELHLELPFDFGILMLNLSRDMARTISVLISHLVEASLSHPVT